MGSCVYLWVDRLSEDGLLHLFYHTAICVYLEGQKKYVFSYNSFFGYRCNRAEQEECPKEEVFLGYAPYNTLKEVNQIAEHLFNTKFKELDWTESNCTHFANELSSVLCGKSIPTKYVIQDEVGAAAGTGVTAARTILGDIYEMMSIRK